jgi:hypothetical protein
MDYDGFYMGTTVESLRKTSDYAYGLGLVDVVVVVSVFFSAAGAVVMVLVVSLVFSVEAGGFTIVVLFSVFFSAGAAGATVSVFCSHAPRSAALARMQSNFFIVMDWLPRLGTMPDSNEGESPALLKLFFHRPSAFRRLA